MKMQVALIGALALGLAACGGGETSNMTENVDNQTDAYGSGATDLETTNLDIDANASAVDQAVDSAGQESGLDNTLDEAGDSVGNVVE